jgi:hypothetical protein
LSITKRKPQHIELYQQQVKQKEWVLDVDMTFKRDTKTFVFVSRPVKNHAKYMITYMITRIQYQLIQFLNYQYPLIGKMYRTNKSSQQLQSFLSC